MGAMRWDDLNTEACSVARTVSVIGDRWTILILRDCFLRVRRFEDFERRLGITRHVLADRLRKLGSLGVLRRMPYQERPRRYEYRLTPQGVDRPPVMLEHRDCGHVFDPVVVCSHCGGPVDAHNVRTRAGPGARAASETQAD